MSMPSGGVSGKSRNGRWTIVTSADVLISASACSSRRVPMKHQGQQTSVNRSTFSDAMSAALSRLELVPARDRRQEKILQLFDARKGCLDDASAFLVEVGA